MMQSVPWRVAEGMIFNGSLRLNLTQHGKTHQVNYSYTRLGLVADHSYLQECRFDDATPAGTGNAMTANPVASLEVVCPETVQTHSKRWVAGVSLRFWFLLIPWFNHASLALSFKTGDRGASWKQGGVGSD